MDGNRAVPPTVSVPRTGSSSVLPRKGEILNRLNGKKVTVLGLGRFGGGEGLVRFLSGAGCRVTVTDKAGPSELQKSSQAVQGLAGVRLALGTQKREFFTECDFLFVSPGVPPGNPFVRLSRECGVPVSTEVALFLSLCPGDVVAVTGTSGKSTTCALTASMLKAAGKQVFLGGNIGGSLLENVESMTPDSKVVLELSSFQLQYLKEGWIPCRPPRISAVTNVASDHLNWHQSFSAYADCKRAVFKGGNRMPGREDLTREGSWAVVPGDDGLLLPWARQSGRQVLSVGCGGRGVEAAVEAAGPELRIRRAGEESPLLRADELRLKGRMNRVNAAFAAGMAFLAGAGCDSIRTGARSFRGLPHRLEEVGRGAGTVFVNSSVATTPLEAARTLEALGGPTVLIAGGSSAKKLPFYPLGKAVKRWARYVALFGQAASSIQAALREEAPSVPCHICAGLEAAVEKAVHEAREGDYILLAPGCPSFDCFANFAARGDAFRTAATRYIS